MGREMGKWGESCRVGREAGGRQAGGREAGE